MILTLPTNFSTSTRRSSVSKEFRRSAGTAATETSSVCASSAQSVGSNDDVDDFLKSLEASYRSGAPSDEDDILKNLMLRHGQDDGEMINSEEHDTLTELKAVDDARIDTLALKVEELEGRYNREERVMRKLRRQGRILKAQEEYMECLEALASTKVVSDGEFFNVAWKEVELDWGT